MRAHRFFTTKSGAAVLLISALLTAASLLALAVIAMAYRTPLLIFELRTEYFAQTVRRPEMSALSVQKADIRGIADCPIAADGFTGLIEAPVGARLLYAWRPGNVSVRIQNANGAVRLVQSGDNECVSSASQISVVIAYGADGAAMPVFAIAGPVEVGSELASAVPPPEGLPRRLDLLLDGGFTVFGRTIWPWGSPGLYPISAEALPIPAGSRISSARDGERERDSWFGIAMPTADGLLVKATAESDQVRLYRPGESTDELTYAFGPFVAIVGDPAIGWLSLFIFIGTTAVQLVGSWVGVWKDDEGWSRWQRWRRRR